ncbi:MAG TPA: TonB-dependent receptor [Gemmatimonadaceae bacterium]|nr:TonB-dependent receptor [Gemmatimonadaceae bacterium]
MRRTLSLALALATSAIPAALAAAPATRADSIQTPAVTGVVTDTAGNPLPNVQVAITALRRGMSTDESGRFLFRGLPAGTHHIDAILIGYAPVHQVITVPEEGQEISVRLRMRPTPVRLSTVQVTATPTGTDALEITRSTAAITGKEFERAVATSISQTLAAEPGLAMRYNGPAANAPVIRGLTGERVLMLQDGARAGDLAGASADHAVTIDPLGASQIEVVRGPASLLYGNSALGGVVNVITNDVPTSVPTHVEGLVATQGESGTRGGAASGSLTAPLGGSVAFNVKGNFRSGGDVRTGGTGRLANSYNRTQGGSAGIGFVGDGRNGGLSYREQHMDYGLPFDPSDPAAEAVHIEGARRQLEARGTFDLSEAAPVTQLKLTGTTQWYHHDEIEPSGAIGTTFKLRTHTADATATTRLGRVKGAVGGQVLLRDYAPTGEEALTPSADSRGFGVFLFEEIPLVVVGNEDVRVPKIEFGARYDYFGIEPRNADPVKFADARDRSFSNFSGSVGLNVPLGDDMTVAVSGSRAFRAPTVEELFSNAFHAANATFDVGDPGLVSEVNQGIDLVLRAQSARLNGQLAGYVNGIANYIAPAIVDTARVDGELVPVARYVQLDARLVGIEGQLEGEVVPHVVLGVMGDLVRGTFTRDDPNGNFADGSPLPYMPPARLGAQLRFDNNRYSAGVELRHAFAQDRVPPAPPRTPQLAEPATDAYDLLNLNAGISRIENGRVHSLTLRLDNALDEQYFDATSRLKRFAASPGRSLVLVYRVLF